MVYFGSQDITASAAKAQCKDPDNLDAYSAGFCKDEYGIHLDSCSHVGTAVDEYICVQSRICNKQLVACNEGDECRLFDGNAKCVKVK